MKIIFSTLLILHCIFTPLLSQIIPDWIGNYGGTEYEAAHNIVEINAEGITIFGVTRSTDLDVSVALGKNDFWLLNVNYDGELVWEKSFGGLLNEAGNEALKTEDGGYLLADYSSSKNGDAPNDGGDNPKSILIKLDTNLEVLWSKSYSDGIISNYNVWVQELENGNYLMVTNKGLNAILLEVNKENGEIVWERELMGSKRETPTDILFEEDGSFVLLVNSLSDDFDFTENYGFSDVWVFKFDENGNVLWQVNIGGETLETAMDIVKSADGGYVIAGSGHSQTGWFDGLTPLGSVDIFVTKIDANGNKLWVDNFGGSGFDYATQMTTFGDNFIIACNSTSNNGDVTGNNGMDDVWMFALNNEGEMLWENTIGGSESDFIDDLIEFESKLYFIFASRSNDGDLQNNYGERDIVIMGYSDFPSSIQEINELSEITIFPNLIQEENVKVTWNGDQGENIYFSIYTELGRSIQGPKALLEKNNSSIDNHLFQSGLNIITFSDKQGKIIGGKKVIKK